MQALVAQHNVDALARGGSADHQQEKECESTRFHGPSNGRDAPKLNPAAVPFRQRWPHRRVTPPGNGGCTARTRRRA
ncbi:hypothetical protein PAGU2638_19490 [Lysobacter sp. PAGU 2638]